jgi:hypothetical protein
MVGEVPRSGILTTRIEARLSKLEVRLSQFRASGIQYRYEHRHRQPGYVLSLVRHGRLVSRKTGSIGRDGLW